MIINGLITGAAVLLAAAVLWGAWLWLGRDEGRHTADALTSDYGTLTYGYVPAPAAAVEPLPPRQKLPPPPVLHHDEYAPPQRWHPAPPAPAAAAATDLPVPPPPVTSPLAAAVAAHGAIRALPAGEYMAHLERATAWEDRPPFTGLLSDDTIARGMPAIKAEVT